MKINQFIKACMMALTIMPISAAAQEAEATLSFETITIEETNKAIDVNIDLTNPTKTAIGLQFDMTLPEGLSFVNMDEEGTSDYYADVTERSPMVKVGRVTIPAHTVKTSFPVEGSTSTMRVLVYSDENKALEGNSGAIVFMQIMAAESFEKGTIKIHDATVIFEGHSAETPNKTAPADVEYEVANTSGIEGVMMDKAENGPVYNLQGIRVSEMNKGVYIVNGKKVVKN